MREIKFRCWNGKNKKYIYQSKTDRIDKCLTYYELNIKTILEQYIGLKDKNEKEIYEGDIVKYELGDIDECVFVRYSSGVLPQFVNVDKDGCEHMDDIDDWHTLEIIGNIHENPELMI